MFKVFIKVAIIVAIIVGIIIFSISTIGGIYSLQNLEVTELDGGGGSSSHSSSHSSSGPSGISGEFGNSGDSGSGNAASGTDSSGTTGDDGFVQYYQSDSEWASLPWGGGNIASSGCGPTSMAMVLTNLTGQRITPKDTTGNNPDDNWCGPQSYYVPDAGTGFNYYPAAASHYSQKLNKNITCTQTSSFSDVVSALRSGSLVISSQSAGLFTRVGHLIVLSAVDSSGKVTVKDPNRANAEGKGYNNRKFTESEIMASNLAFFIFSI